MNQRIEEKFYKKIIEVLPIPCVDLLIISNNKFFLGKRVNSPARGQWFLPGGRVLKGEVLSAAAKRKVEEELGVKMAQKDFKFLTTTETIFNKEKPPKHTINSVFVCDIGEKAKKIIVDDSQISEIIWSDKVQNSWPAYVKNILRLYGFK